jgi:hypothetical protein
MTMRALALFALLSFACGSEEAPPVTPRSRVTVAFVYRATTEANQQVIDDHPECAMLVGLTHIHPSWRSYEVIALKPEGPDLWTWTFDDVPVGEHKIRISDRNFCEFNATGAVTSTVVFANDVLLTERVGTPGTGLEPGFGFSVAEDGTVTP